MKVALYGRVSTDEQKENQTINNQKRELDKYIKSNDHGIYSYYLDEGVSGTIPFEVRPEGRRLLEDAETKKFDFVLVLKTDRLGRNLKVMLNAVDTLSRLNIGFKSISEPYNTQTPEGKMMFNIISSFSEYDWNNIQKNSMRGKERAIDEGRWIGGVPPYGYIVNKDTKKLELYDEKVLLGKYSEVDVIRMMFDWCANKKMTCEKIAMKLYNMGIPTSTPRKNNLKRKKAEYWYGERVRYIISNETYKGEKIIGKRSNTKKPKIMKVPPIVSEEIWQRAQEIKESNKILSLRNSVRQYLLTRKIRCGLCGRSFTGLAYYGYTYYACNKYRLKNVKHPGKCKNKVIRADVLEDEIWSDLKTFIDNPIAIESFLHQKLSNMSRIDIDKKLKNINRELDKIKREKVKLIKYIRSSDSCLEKDINVEIAKINKEESELLEKKEYYEEINRREEFEKKKVSEIEKVMTLFNDKIKNPDFKLKKGIIDILVDKIIVHPYDEKENKRLVEIYYSFNKKGVYINKLSLKR